MFGWFRKDSDNRLLKDVVKHYQPSMRVVSNGCGWCLKMDPEDGRRTAKIKTDRNNLRK